MKTVESVDGGKAGSDVLSALQNCRPSFVGVAVFSAFINILSLTGSLYMLQVYDRVLASHSVATLVGISALACGAYLLQGALDALRSRMLARIGAKFGESLSGRVYEGVTTLPLKGIRPALAIQAIRDLDQIQRFLSGAGPTAMFDTPFMPVFLFACFLLHPWLGWLVVVGGSSIVVLTVLTEIRTRNPTMAATVSAATRHAILEVSARNAEALKGLGMTHAFAKEFALANGRHSLHSLDATDAASGIGSMAKVFRAMLQSAVLGLGAYLAIYGEVSAGAMIAASILSARALAPVEVAVANWRGFVAARHGYARLEKLLGELDPVERRLPLPKPRLSVAAEDLYVVAPGKTKPIVQGVSFEVKAGQGLAIIGPSASGKSTLARALIGVWPAARGKVRLDGASLDRWQSERLGGFIGYLPQDVELFDGTVTENICRFSGETEPTKIVQAAREAGAHEMILRLPQGYETRIGDQGAALSAGQRQRVALARALYGEPFLVVLDEPNSNLDSEGEEALVGALLSVRRRGGVAVVVTHRPTALAGVDLVAVMIAGRLQAFGKKEPILERMTLHGRQKKAPLRTAQQTA